jgi:hypothetical protein
MDSAAARLAVAVAPAPSPMPKGYARCFWCPNPSPGARLISRLVFDLVQTTQADVAAKNPGADLDSVCMQSLRLLEERTREVAAHVLGFCSGTCARAHQDWVRAERAAGRNPVQQLFAVGVP